MTFLQPWALALLLPAVVLVFWVGRHGIRTVSARQHRVAILLRTVAVSGLVVALAQPLLLRGIDERSVLFLLDRSESVGAAARELQEEIVNRTLGEARPIDRVAVAVFGSEVAVDQSLAVGRTSIRVLSEVDGSATDIEGALRAAGSLLPTEGSRRVVLITDGVETVGSARTAASELAETGIVVDVIRLDTTRSPDALVEAVTLPPATREGDRVPVEVVIRSTTAGPANLKVTVGDEPAFDFPVSLESGENRVTFEVEAPEPGFLQVGVELETEFDTRGENDVASGITRVLGPAGVVIVEGKTGEAEELGRALEAAGLVVTVRSAIPDDEELLRHDAVILVNVGRPSMEAAESLAAYVQDLGRGLVVIGGDQAYGLGEYHLTPLESILPVSSNPDDLIRRQRVAEVLVIDTSGSMAACHCNETSPAGGVNKTDISRAGAAAAIEALATTDKVGVLAFSSGYDWVLPLAGKPDPASTETALGGLFPEGDTEIAPALEEALTALAGVPEELRHIVLFTDGWDPNEANLLPVVREIADAGITLSVVGTGEGPGVTLQRMAELGNGRYYPGTDLLSVPEIFVEETLTVARNLATEGTFFPALGARTPVTEHLTEAPPLSGYVLTKSKGTSAVALEIGEGDPLLATWQRGLGRVTAWTSDATARWSTDWVAWDGYVEFWGAVVRDVLPSRRDTPPEVRVENGVLRISLTDEGFTDQTTAVARVRLPGGETISVPLTRSGIDSFAGETRAAGAGAYWASVTVDAGDGSSYTTGSGAVSSYEEEFAFHAAEPGLAEALASLTQGRIDPEVERLFDPAPVEGRARLPIWPWLVGAALAAFVIDVALRRLVIGSGDSQEWRQVATSERRREVARTAQVVEKRRTEAEAAGEVASDSETLQRLMRRKTR